jgi:hypothetical protein
MYNLTILQKPISFLSAIFDSVQVRDAVAAEVDRLAILMRDRIQTTGSIENDRSLSI